MTRVRVARSITELQAQFRHISDRAAELGRRADPQALVRRPAPESWSPAECFVHLNLSVDPYLPIWRHAMEPAEGARLSGRDRYRPDFWGRVLVWTLEPPPRFRFSAPRAFWPASTGPPSAVVPAFVERQEAILALLETAGGAAIDSIRIVSPFDGRVRYTVWSSFCVTAAHERRHLWQAERALGPGGGK